MAVLIFWLVWLTITAYLHQQWQRYEPTRVAIDGAAALASFPIAVVAAIAVA